MLGRSVLFAVQKDERDKMKFIFDYLRLAVGFIIIVTGFIMVAPIILTTMALEWFVKPWLEDK